MVSPISSNVIECWFPSPKYNRITSASRNVKVSSALSISVRKASCKSERSGFGDSRLRKTSYVLESLLFKKKFYFFKGFR